MSESIVLDCSPCVDRETEACGDCLVRFVVDHESGPVVLDPDDVRALGILADAGLVPRPRHLRAAG